MPSAAMVAALLLCSNMLYGNLFLISNVYDMRSAPPEARRAASRVAQFLFFVDAFVAFMCVY